MLAASTTAVRMRGLAIRCAHASESGHRKSNGSKKIAGVIITGTGTFLIGHTVIGCLNKQLRRSYYSDDREDAEGNVYRRSVIRGTELTVKHAIDSIGKLVALTATASTTLFDLCTENDRLYRLYDSGGLIVTYGIKIANVAIVVVGAGRIRSNSTFSAIKNYILFKSGNTFEGLASAYAQARLKLEEDVISDVDLIKSVVKRNLVYTYVCPKYLCALCLNVGSRCENFLSECGKIYTCILEAISVTATVENPFSVDAHCSSQILITSEGSVSVFLHCNFSSFKVLKAHSTIMIWSVI
jgi:hypothetical protein